VKSSTGFYTTENNLPMAQSIDYADVRNATPLPVKAAGGVRTYDEAVEMIKLGVKRIGNFWGKANGENTNIGY
jgi:deoxyribose-phosphate aldolase